MNGEGWIQHTRMMDGWSTITPAGGGVPRFVVNCTFSSDCTFQEYKNNNLVVVNDVDTMKKKQRKDEQGQ